MLVIGERINSTRKSIAKAIESKDHSFIQNEAKIQADAGADYLDVNAGAFIGQEEDYLKWLIDTVQAATELPLCIDSPEPDVIRAAFPLVDKPPMINSITLEPVRLEKILPLVQERKGTKVIGLCQSEDAMGQSAEEKLEFAGGLVEAVSAAGIDPGALHIDPLVNSLAAKTSSALATLDAIEGIMKTFPGVHTTCGLTNISYGLPSRKLVNRTFLVSAITKGLDSVIMDPTDKSLNGTLKAAVMVMGQDDFCLGYIRAYRGGGLE